MKKKTLVTLSDIARRVKVSKVTVSKALRGHPDISAETAGKVKKVARELGYLPNFMARNLSSRRSNTIGVIVPKIAHFFFSSVIEAIYDAAFENNYEIILTVSQENAERELRHVESLLSMRVDGLIISLSQQTRDTSVFDRVQQRGVPLTFMDRVIDRKEFNTVVADDRGGAAAAIEQAVRTGYRKIAHLGGPQHTNIGRERYLGFADALQQHGLAVNPAWVSFGGFNEAYGYEAFLKLWRSGDPPEFVFAVTFPVALGIYRAVDELGLRIPDDIDLICFGNSGLNSSLSPPMSYIEQPTTEMGRKAFEITLEHVHHPERTAARHVALPTRLVLCKTCVEKTSPSPQK